jgi:hypothetical protein
MLHIFLTTFVNGPPFFDLLFFADAATIVHHLRFLPTFLKHLSISCFDGIDDYVAITAVWITHGLSVEEEYEDAKFC